MSDSTPPTADLRHITSTGAIPSDPTRLLLEHGTIRNPHGSELIADQYGLVLDDQHWMPVMGELQYSRLAKSRWRDGLLQMKAAGVDIVATYVFWNHHEEQEGVFDFNGRRSLRDFVQLCGELGLDVQLRIGPWAHGEARNGGFPDWLMKKGSVAHRVAEAKVDPSAVAHGISLRSDDPKYLAYVRRYFEQVAEQTRGMLWKDGGPISGMQLENEYPGPSEHLLKLKEMVVELGLDVPLYYFTGWPRPETPMPLGKMIPLYGGYAEGMWDRSLEIMPGGYWEAFTFQPRRMDATIATDHFGVRAVKDEGQAVRYPYLTCEVGGGMVTSYHRRIRIFPRDVASIALIKIGCGNSMPGYYVFHGGTNPTGKFTTLNESQASGYPNDICTMSYDFQAPIGEFGQLREHYHWLRRMHMLIHEFDEQLTAMRSLYPAAPPRGKTDVKTLRWCVRGNDSSAFIFVNNYQRLQPMPAKTGVQFTLQFQQSDITLPRQPVTIPPDCYFIWPVQVDLGRLRLIYATAQLICSIDAEDARYIFFSQITGIPAQFALDESSGKITTSTGEVTRSDGRAFIENLTPSLNVAVGITTPAGKNFCFVLLDEPTSLQAWKLELAGKPRLALTTALPLADQDHLRCRVTGTDAAEIAIFPPPSAAIIINGKTDLGRTDGLFQRYNLVSAITPATAAAQPVRPASRAQPVLIGPHGVAEAPGETQFADAAVWRIVLPENLAASNDWLLRFHYVGDVARVYLDGKLITDNFYNGVCFDCGFSPDECDLRGAKILLKIMPLRSDAPICLLPQDWPKPPSEDGTAELLRVEIIQQVEHQLTFI